ncbi:MAG: class I SAM-dependent DNA methyltransferase, partial [Ignavibacteria bacterium]
MNLQQAVSLIRDTFEEKFNERKFSKFISEILKNKYDVIDKTFSGIYIPEPYQDFVESYKRLLKYESNSKRIDVLIVKLKSENSLLRARSKQRNFIRDYLIGKHGSTSLKDAALVAFYSDDSDDWRFSLVKIDYSFDELSLNRGKTKEILSPAKRWSFLVGKNEKSHTAQSRFIPILENENWILTLEDLEKAFNVEIVTKEFFEQYRDLFIRTKWELDKIVNQDERVKEEFEQKKINNVDFAKKLLGQIVFLYFLQKKGWFGVEKGKPWGTGPKDFIRRLFNKEFGDYE